MTPSTPLIIGPEAKALLSWTGMLSAFEAGHRLPKAQIGDTFLYRDADTLLTRAAMIDGLGAVVKTASVFPGNPEKGQPMVNGSVSLFADGDGCLEAVIDFHLVTYWKTAADSLLAAKYLAPPKVQTLLVLGAGTVAGSLIDAYRSIWPDVDVRIWNRSPAAAEDLAARVGGRAVRDLSKAVPDADIICSATMATSPILQGDWLRPGQHVDLIGAFRPDMREADDRVMQRGRVFVDSFDTTLDHIGELKIPLQTGALQRADVLADYYALETFTRDPDDITVFKNGGGAHLDLMVAREILSSVQDRAAQG